MYRRNLEILDIPRKPRYYKNSMGTTMLKPCILTTSELGCPLYKLFDFRERGPRAVSPYEEIGPLDRRLDIKITRSIKIRRIQQKTLFGKTGFTRGRIKKNDKAKQEISFK